VVMVWEGDYMHQTHNIHSSSVRMESSVFVAPCPRVCRGRAVREGV